MNVYQKTVSLLTRIANSIDDRYKEPFYFSRKEFPIVEQWVAEMVEEIGKEVRENWAKEIAEGLEASDRKSTK